MPTEPNLPQARRNAAVIGNAVGVQRALVPGAGSYVSEAGYVAANRRQRSFGANYARLLAVQRRYDPDGLFFTHRGVSSEEWSADGCTRL